MTWAAAAAASAAATAAIGGVVLGADAQKGAIAESGAQQQANLRAQQGLTNQQLELSRPLVETRDSALNLLNTLFGLPQVQPTLQRSQQGGTALVPIPNTTYKTRANGGLDAQTAAFYDPVNRTIVGPQGELLANIPEGGGTIDRLTNGKNNPVTVDANGNLSALTSSAGSVPLLQAPPVPDVPQVGEAAGGIAPDRAATIESLLDLPGFQFVRDEGNKQIEQQLAARGLRESGQGLKALTEFNNNLTSTRFSDFVLNPLFQLAGFGNSGTGVASNSLTNLSGAVGQGNDNLSTLALLGGQNRASAFANGASAIGNGIGDLVSLMGRTNNTTTPGGTGASGTKSSENPAFVKSGAI